jgi:hypothetical protein
MASNFPKDSRWSLSDFADFHLREFPSQTRPSEAGRACAEYISRFKELKEDIGESSVEHAEDQIATGLIAASQLFFPWGGFQTSALPPKIYPLAVPIVVVHGSGERRRYASIREYSGLPDWGEGKATFVWRDDIFLRGPTPFELVFEELLYYRSSQPYRGDFPLFGTLIRAIRELAHAWEFIPSIAMPPVPRRLTSGTPSPAIQTIWSTGSASVGVWGHSHGVPVATTAAHGLGGASTLQILGTACPVKQVDLVQDAATIDVSALRTPNISTVIGPLSGIAPAGGAAHSFEGASSKAVSDVVIGWDVTIPWTPSSMRVQSRVYTGCCTTVGDSGAALINSNNRVVGFAQFSVAGATKKFAHQSSYPGFAAWVWADSVYSALSIT